MPEPYEIDGALDDWRDRWFLAEILDSDILSGGRRGHAFRDLSRDAAANFMTTIPPRGNVLTFNAFDVENQGAKTGSIVFMRQYGRPGGVTEYEFRLGFGPDEDGVISTPTTFNNVVTFAGPLSVVNFGTPASGTNLPAPPVNVYQPQNVTLFPSVSYVLRSTDGAGGYTPVLTTSVDALGVPTTTFGAGANLTGIPGTAISTGTVDPARLPIASTILAGIINTGVQILAGEKVFGNNLSLGNALGSAEYVHLQLESSGTAQLLATVRDSGSGYKGFFHLYPLVNGPATVEASAQDDTGAALDATLGVRDSTGASRVGVYVTEAGIVYAGGLRVGGTLSVSAGDISGLSDVATSGAADDVVYDPTASGLTATDVQAAIDELAGMVGGSVAWASITGTPTTLAGYGIADAQPLNADLTAIAALTTTAYGRGFLPLADAAAALAYIGAGTGTGTVTSVTAGSGLTGGVITTAGTVAVDWGTGTNQVRRGDDAAYTDARTPVGTPLLDAKIWLGSGGNVAAAATLSGVVTINNTGNTGIVNGTITDAALRSGVACSVIGRSVNSTGAEADIQAASNDQFLRRRSNVLGFGSILAADVPTFVAAGGSAAAGAVPSPGATAHTNTQYVLSDTAAFVAVKGQLLGYLYVATDQSTTSTTYVDLATADSVAFTLDATQDVIVEYSAQQYNNTASGSQAIQVFLDGAAQAASIQAQQIPTANVAVVCYLSFKLAAVAAGAHTINIKRIVSTGQTGHWMTRATKVSLIG